MDLIGRCEYLISMDQRQLSNLDIPGGGESPLRAWCEAHGLPIVRPPIWKKDVVVTG